MWIDKTSRQSFQSDRNPNLTKNWVPWSENQLPNWSCTFTWRVDFRVLIFDPLNDHFVHVVCCKEPSVLPWQRPSWLCQRIFVQIPAVFHKTHSLNTPCNQTSSMFDLCSKGQLRTKILRSTVDGKRCQCTVGLWTLSPQTNKLWFFRKNISFRCHLIPFYPVFLATWHLLTHLRSLNLLTEHFPQLNSLNQLCHQFCHRFPNKHTCCLQTPSKKR